MQIKNIVKILQPILVGSSLKNCKKKEKKNEKENTFIFASVIFLMLRYSRITYVFMFLVDFGLLSYMSTTSVKIITSAMSTQLYGSLLNNCTFFVIHKVKYWMVLSFFVWMHHLAILRYTWQKRKQNPFSFLRYTASCRHIWRTQGLELSSKASAW